MSENLGNFLVDLACDPDLLGRFRENPQAELARTALTLDEQAAILARDSRRLASALGASPSKSGGGVLNKKKKGSKRTAAKKGSRKPAGSKKTKH